MLDRLRRLWSPADSFLASSRRSVRGSRSASPRERGHFESLEARRVLASWTQQEELLSTTLSVSDDLGRSVAIDGDLAVVGAPRDDFGVSTLTNEGRVFVFQRTGTAWTEVAQLIASDASAGDQFGYSVAISNGTIVVGAIADDVTFPDTGSAYVFEPSGPNAWTETAKLVPVPDIMGQDINGEGFGESVAIEGNTIVVGARSDNDEFGVISGSAYVFKDTGSGWNALPPKKLRASDGGPGDRFGFDVDIYANRVVVGAPDNDDLATDDGAVYVFDRPTPGSDFAEVAKIIASGDQSTNDRFGTSVAVEGSTILIGAPNEATNGAAYVFTGGGASWAVEAKLLPSTGSLFGTAVDLQGGLAVVGATGGTMAVPNGSVFAFAKSGGVWGSGDLITADDSITGDQDFFGQSVALDAGTIVVGSYRHNHNSSITDSGAAYIFVDPNDAPVNSVPGPQAINEGDTLTFSAGNLNAISISDVDAFGAEVEVTLSATNGTLTLGGITGLMFAPGGGDGLDDATMTFQGTIAEINAALEGTVFTPTDADYFGPASVSILTDDLGNTGTGGPQTDSDSVSITVNPVNDAPTLATAADHTSNEDAGPQSVAGFATASPGPANESAQTLTYNILSNTNAALFAVQPAIAANGTLTYEAAANANGSATITVEVMDDGGTANDGVNTSAPVVFTITVNAVNDDPTVANAIADVTAAEDAADTVLDLSATFADVDIATNADSLTLSVAGNSNSGLVSTAIVGNMLTLSYAANQNGSSTITVRATDLAGAFVETAFLVTVNAVNDIPVADSQTENVTEDGQKSIPLGGSDVETAEANLVFTITSLPATGVLSFGGNAVEVGDTFTGPPTLVYEPAVGSGATSAAFTFTVTDDGDDSEAGQADQTSAPATVSINITAAVPDGMAELTGGILRVGGTGGSDSLTVDQIGSTVRVTINGADTDFPAGSVTEIRVFGRDGNDLIVIDAPVALDTLIDAGSGNDIVYGGSGNDLVFGGDGLDLLFGNGGNDMLIGGDGSDLLVGGAGHDVLVAGSVAPQFTAAMLRDVAAAWAAERTAEEGEDDGTLDESAADENFDILSGGAGADWFIINLGDWVIDYRPRGANGDHITYV